MNRSDFTFSFPLRVRWSEVDRQNVVFNGNYFLYFDVAVAEYWRAIGQPYPQGYVDTYGQDIYAVKATAEFIGSAHYDETLDVYCRCGRIGRSSMQLVLGIYRGDERLTAGELIYVNAVPETKKSAPWPEAFKQRILAYERLAPETASGAAR